MTMMTTIPAVSAGAAGSARTAPTTMRTGSNAPIFQPDSAMAAVMTTTPSEEVRVEWNLMRCAGGRYKNGEGRGPMTKMTTPAAATVGNARAARIGRATPRSSDRCPICPPVSRLLMMTTIPAAAGRAG